MTPTEGGSRWGTTVMGHDRIRPPQCGAARRDDGPGDNREEPLTPALRMVDAGTALVFGLLHAVGAVRTAVPATVFAVAKVVASTRTGMENALEALRQAGPLVAESREALRDSAVMIRATTDLAHRLSDRLDDLDAHQLRDLVTRSSTLADALTDVVTGIDAGRLQSLITTAAELTELAHQKTSGVDLDAVGERLRRLEEALLNIEAGTLNLDRSFEGSIESLPNFVSNRAKRERKKIDPTRPPSAPPDET